MQLFHRFLPLSLIFLLVALGSLPNPARVVRANDSATFAQQVVELTNRERVANGLPPLKLNAKLADAADWMGKDMAAGNYLNHTDSSGRKIDQRLRDFGYSAYTAIGENVAAGQMSAAGVMITWMESATHRANILSINNCEMAAGYGFNASAIFKHYWVQDFGCRSETYPVVINEEAAQTDSANVRLYIYGTGWAQQMRFSNDGVTWSDWEPYSATRNWTLADGNGTRTVYVELRNGTTVHTANDAIQLTAPSQPPTTSPSTAPTTTTPAPVPTTTTPAPTVSPTQRERLYLPLLRTS